MAIDAKERTRIMIDDLEISRDLDTHILGKAPFPVPGPPPDVPPETPGEPPDWTPAP
jgi:hypothetical protein